MTTPNGKKRVLVLDDEPDIVTYLVMLLRDAGYDTLSARNATEGMALIRSEKPDLVTLDISMPQGSGTNFYKELKTDPDLSEIPVVIITAITDESCDPYAFRDTIVNHHGVPAPEGYFTKPIDRVEFLSTIRSLLS
jgi:two-component system phosphate regulon response regulator PhoB